MSSPKSNKVLIAWGIISVGAGAFLVLAIPLELPSTHQALGFLARAGIIGGLIFFISFWLGKRAIRTQEPVNAGRMAWLWYAMPCFVVWTVYLMAFWPGCMSPDSLCQWKETLTGRFTDWHSAFHTMNIWLINHLWHSPAAVAFAQIFALGSIAGWGLAGLGRLGAPRKMLWGVSLLFALSLVNGLMVITLWKDIAYSISVLALTLLVVQIVSSNGLWFTKRGAWLILALTIILVALYRHNGIVPAFGTPLILLLFYRRFWRRILSALLLALILFVGIRGPLYDALDVARGRPLVEERLSKLVKTITRDSNREGDHSPGSIKSIIKKDLQRSSHIWRIQPDHNYFKRIEYVNFWKDETNRLRYIGSNKLGIAPSSVLPGVKAFMFEWYQQSIRPPLYYFIWSPAFYLYLFLASVAIASVRAGSWKFLALAAPILFHALPFLMMRIPLHKFIHRYHYPVILVGMLLSIPLLFTPFRVNDDGDVA